MFLERKIHPRVTEKMSAEGGRWLGLNRRGLTTDSASELSSDVGGRGLFARSTSYRDLSRFLPDRQLRPSVIPLVVIRSATPWCHTLRSAKRGIPRLDGSRSAYDFPWPEKHTFW